MKFCGVCVETDNAPRLAAFYQALLQEEPLVEGSHYGFSLIAIHDPGGVRVSEEKSIWLSFSDENIDSLYERLLREIPGVSVLAPPERKPWGAYSFWVCDPDGNKITVFQQKG